MLITPFYISPKQGQLPNKKYDFIVVFVDTDYVEPRNRVTYFVQQMKKICDNNACELPKHECRIITIRKCFETWLLGNRKAYPDATVDNDVQMVVFEQYRGYFNVNLNDPEMMDHPQPEQYRLVSQYHLAYLKAMLACPPMKISYEKRSYNQKIADFCYLEQLRFRATDKNRHLGSFREFLKCIEFMNTGIWQWPTRE